MAVKHKKTYTTLFQVPKSYQNWSDLKHHPPIAKTDYDKKSDEGSNSVRMRPENSGALKVVTKWLSTRVSDSSDAQLSDYV